MVMSNSDRISTEIGLGFDDVLLVPDMSFVQASKVDLQTRFSRNLKIHIPLVSSALDTITETRMAIAMAQLGGMGVIHKNMPVSKQAEKIRKVKRFQARIVRDVISVPPEMSISEVLDYKIRYALDYLPVVESGTQQYKGMLFLDDTVSFDDPSKTVADFMSSKPVPTVSDDMNINDIYALMQKENAPFTVLLNQDQHCVGLVTQEDRQKQSAFPHASVDGNGSLLVAAAVGVGEDHFDRVNTLIDAGVDAIVIDAGHGHSKSVTDMVTFIRRQQGRNVDVIAGNIATTDGALALLDAGADAIKVGIGSGTHCTTHDLTGVGVPQFTALMNVVEACAMHDIPVIADGGIRTSGDIAKALAAGTSSVMMASLLAGAAETPAERNNDKAPSLADVIHPLAEGLRTSMCYTGCENLKDFRTRTRFIRLK